MLSLPRLTKPKQFRLTLRLVAIVLGVSSGVGMSIFAEEKLYWWAATMGFILLVATLMEFIVADILTENKYPRNTQHIIQSIGVNPEGYDQQIKSSIQQLIDSLHACEKSKVSGTFHLKVETFDSEGKTDESLLQLTDYTGHLGGQKWRFVDDTKGVIGRCVRTGKTECVNFASEEEYNVRMVEEFGFTRTEMERHTNSGRSYLAKPVTSGTEMVGVIYLFSTEYQVFPESVEKRDLDSAERSIVAYLRGARVIG